MNTEDPKWEPLSRQLFSGPEPKAPPFLWTRILAAIEQREQELLTWWSQWRWMGRIAAAMTVGVTLVAGIVFYDVSQGVPLENLLKGITSPQQTAQLSNPPNVEEVTAWLTEGGPSWEEN